MSYNFYRQSGPSWGTQQFRFGAPPAPSFQPQPSWGGWDYYRAHVGASPDPSLFDSAWNRVRDYSYSNYGDYSGGVGIHEARHWHNRAYGGMRDINQMLPAEIGHAAAYEAYRKWIHHSTMYEPLSADFEKQREALIGLAVAETTLLLQYTTRGNDPYTRRNAADAAASTASQIFFWSRDHDDVDGSDAFHGRGRSYGSYGGGSSYGDPYSNDTDRRRFRSRSPYRHSMMDDVSSVSSSIPIMRSSYGYGSNYDNSYGSYPGVPMNGSMSMGGGMSSAHPVRGRSMSIMGAGPYTNTQYPGMSYPYSTASPQTQYVHAGGVVAPSAQLQQGQMPLVLYTKPKKHHHHHRSGKHGHKKRSRSVSVEPMYIRF